MTAYDTHTVVVHHVVVVLHVTLHLWVAALVVSPETMMNGPVTSAVGDTAEALGLNTLAVYTILPRDVVGILDMNIVPRTPRHGAVVHNKILALIKRKRTLAAVDTLAPTHSYIAHYHIFGFGGNNATAVNGDTLTGGRLSGNGDIAGNSDALACNVYHTAHIEHDKTSRLAHGIGQRPRSCCVQIGDMDHLTPPATSGIRAITLSARESQLLPLGYAHSEECRHNRYQFFHINVHLALFQLLNYVFFLKYNKFLDDNFSKRS